MKETNASARWMTLDGEVNTFITRCEEYAALTIPKICYPPGFNTLTDEGNQDLQSIGAQAVNHLTNKLVLTLFSPSKPFFRMDISDKAREEIQASLGADDSALQEILSTVEKNAMRELDKKSLRPKLTETIKHLIVTGNVLLVLDKKRPRVIPLRNYRCKRNAEGEVLEIVIRDEVKVGHLDKDIRELFNKDYETCVCHYRWIVRQDDGKYTMTQFIDDLQLPTSFDARWSETKMPYRALTWDLADNSDYGTGHVEDYAGDFRALSALNRAYIESAILSSEFRWLANPNGITKPEDIEVSRNGSVIPGQVGDLTLLNSQTPSALQYLQIYIQEYTNRIGRGFMLGSASTRNAERVTAEEIRLQAQELETGLGGAYSRIAVDLQVPFAHYLLDSIDIKYKDKDIEPVIITGMDALSRNNDLDNLKLLLGDAAAVQQLNPNQPILSSLNLVAIIKQLAAARGIETSKIMQPQEVIDQQQQLMQQQMMMAQQQQMAGQPPRQ